MRRRIVFIALLLQMALASVAFAESSQITNGLNYLASTQNADGSWISGEEQTIATTKIIETLKLLNQTSTANYTNALSWLQNQQLESTNHVAERIFTLAIGGPDSTALISYLDELALAWGGYDDFMVDNLDTASALQALKAINYANQTTIQSAISYLLAHQNSDGGWGFENGDISNLYMTAVVISTLSKFKNTYNLQNQINNGAVYLLSKQNADGGFGSLLSTAYETGLTMEALIASGVNIFSASQPAINYLASSQLADGSWDADPYTTALALRAFVYFKPDMVITASDITFSKPDPVAGDTIEVTANIRNDGPAVATDVAVKFYNGDPDAGGTLIGESVVPSIAAFGSTQAKITWTIPTAFAGQVFVVVNPLKTVDELNTNNNIASKNLTTATLPDLSISSADISFNPSSAHAGESVVISASVRNIGESSANNVVVDFYDGDPNANGTAIGTSVISSISAGNAAAASISGTFTNGVHSIYVIIDRANSISEGSKTNNTATKALTISSGKIDLSIVKEDISFSPINPKDGSQVAINAAIRNLGESTINNAEVAFYLGDPNAGGTAIGSIVTVPAISAGGLANVNVSWDLTGHAGENNIYVKVDPQNLITETTKLNNQAYKAIVVLGSSGADLSISAGDIQITPSQPNAGEQAVISATIYNIGTQDATNVRVETSLGDPRLGGAFVFGSQTIPSIPQGGSATVQTTLNTTGYAGTYQIYFNIDPLGSVIETDKINNLARKSIIVKVFTAPDLAVTAIDTSGITTDSQTLAISGNVLVTIKNSGNSNVTVPFDITVFEDTDKDKKLTSGTDNLVGSVTYNYNLVSGASDTLMIPVSGTVLFKDNLLYAMVDSANSVEEINETNNIFNTGEKCKITPSAGTFSPVVKWKWTGSNILPEYNQVTMTPVVGRIADTNGDGVIDEKDVPAIIFNTWIFGNSSNNYNYDGVLRAIRGDNGQEILTISDSSLRVNPTAQIALGDIDNDGFIEIIVPASDRSVLCFDHTGVLKWKSPVVSSQGNMWGGPSIADIDNNGYPVVIIAATVLNGNDGSIRWQGTGDGSGPSTFIAPLSNVADIDLDGVPEIIYGRTAYKNDGTILWHAPISWQNGYSIIGKIDDNDPYPQVILSVSCNLYLLDHRGQTKWSTSIGYGNCGAPTAADFDGDGKPEIGVVSDGWYVVFKNDGSVLWQASIQESSSSSTSSTVFDFYGDGNPNVVYNDEQYLKIFNGSNGQLLYQMANTSATATEYPIVVDVDNDKHAEIIVSGNKIGNPGIVVLEDANDNWVNTRQIWNQYNYHITNINDNGTIPRIEQNNWDIYNNYRCNVPIMGITDATLSYITADSTNFPSSIKISARLGNGGALVLPLNVDVNFYDGDPASGGIFIGATKTTKDINPGEYENVSVTWNNPAAGVHNVFAIADGSNKITECSRNNNIANASFTFIDSSIINLPDLTLSPSDIVIISPNLTDGQSAVINATIYNIGTLGATNVGVSFYDGDPANGGTLIGATTVSGVGAGATAITSVVWNTYGQSGRNYIHVVIDPQNLIVELNKNNNASLVAIDVAVPTKPDLAITISDINVSNANPKAGEILLVDATIHNLGTVVSNVEVSLYDGDRAVGGTLIIEKTITPIIQSGGTAALSFEINTLGLSGNHVYYIYIDPNNKIDEVNETNNAASVSTTISLTNLNLTISTDKTDYTADEVMQIATNISNLAATGRTESLEIKITDTFGSAVTSLITDQQITLDANEHKTFSTSWNTGNIYSGDYKVVALLNETGVVVARAEKQFTISSIKSVASKISADKMSYKANETVTVSGTVQSTAANIILSNLTAKVTFLNANGTVLYTSNNTITTLTPGQLIQQKSYWNTGGNPQGSYNVKLEVFDGSNLLSISTASFTITGTTVSAQGINGSISATPNIVYAGSDISIGYTVTNSGNEDIPNLRIKILIVDPVTQMVKAEITDQQAVAKGSSIIVVGLNNISTSALVPGTYIAILQVATAAMTEFKTLSKANFEVKTGLEITKYISDATNLLVWVNKKCDLLPGILNMSCLCDDSRSYVKTDLLEKALKDAGVNYHIVYNKNNFQQEIRNPSYSDYMILGDKYLLDSNFADELREAVFAGKGIISSLYVKYGGLGTPVSGALWLSYLLFSQHTIDLNSSPVAAANSFVAYGKAVSVTALSGATVAGWIRSFHSPAIVLNDYGQGRSVYYAFDLLETLNEQNYEDLANLIKNSVLYVHRPLIDNSSFLPYQFVPVNVKIKSLGCLFNLQVKETYPAGFRIYDPVTNQWITKNPWIKDMHIESNEIKNFQYYALTPDAQGLYTLQTEIGFLENGTYQTYTNLDVNVNVEGQDKTVLADDIIAVLRALRVNVIDKLTIYSAIHYIEMVKSRDRQGSSKSICQENILDMLTAINKIVLITSCDTTQVRLMMDMLLRIYENKYYFW